MDCKQEPAARTFIRITLITIQGVLATVLSFAVSVILIPFAPFLLTYSRFRIQKERDKIEGLEVAWWKRAALIPLWAAQSIPLALVIPFTVLRNGFDGIVSVAKSEWANRWRAACPKNPYGDPLSVG